MRSYGESRMMGRGDVTGSMRKRSFWQHEVNSLSREELAMARGQALELMAS